MAIDWKNFETLEKMLKLCTYLRDESIERATILLNLNSPMQSEQLMKKIIKIPAFYEYLVFNEIRKECHEQLDIVITSIYDLEDKIKNPEKIKDPKYFHMSHKLDELLGKFNNFTKDHDAFNDYLAFKITKAKCMEKKGISINSMDNLKYRISSDYPANKKLNGILEGYNKLIINKSSIDSKKEIWFYAPFSILMEPIKLIEYNKEGYHLSSGKLALDLMTSLRDYGILEFCPDKKKNFEHYDPTLIFSRR